MQIQRVESNLASS